MSPKAPSTRPSASGRSQRSRWASLPNRYSGSEPMVTWACQAAATDWSARPICSMAATKPIVDMPIPPHSSGMSMPSRPELAHLPEQVGRAPRLLPGQRRPGRDLLLGEVAAEVDQVAFGFAEREVHRPILLTDRSTAGSLGGTGRRHSGTDGP